MSNVKTVLIVGGAGYIGSHTNFAFLDAGYNTIIFDNLVYGHKEVVPETSKFIQGDLLNKQDLERVFTENKIDAVIHFAAYAYVGESVTNPQKYYFNNVVGTLNLLEAMLNHNVKNIVFSSTCATYGLPENIPITESTSQNPINPYGQTKLMVEKILSDYASAYDLRFVALRYFNACGADVKSRSGEDHEPETHLIPLVLKAAKSGTSIKVFGNDYSTPDGTCIRDYIHVNDLADGHLLALEKILDEKIKAEFINLGTGNGYSVKEIIETAREVTGKEIKVEEIERRAGDPDKLIADNTKAKTVLGWEPEYSDLKTVLETSWKWLGK